MVLRRTVYALGMLAVILGLSQMAFPSWWIGVSPKLVASTALCVGWGLFAGIVGGALIVAALRRLVGLGLFVLILGGLMLASGVAFIVHPSFARDIVAAFVVNPAPSLKLVITFGAGVARVVLGALLIYAYYRPPGDRAQKQG